MQTDSRLSKNKKGGWGTGQEERTIFETQQVCTEDSEEERRALARGEVKNREEELNATDGENGRVNYF